MAETAAKTAKNEVVKTKHCTECACIDPDNLGEPPVTCKKPQYQGDGACDDGNNNAGCEYDGGDCCYKTVEGGEVKKNFCTECKCLDPDNLGEPTGCKSPGYKGDGYCDDGNNNAGCQYDGGDCCYKSLESGVVKTKHCTECACLDPDNLGDAPGASCGSPKFQGDGNCDDNNNNEGCQYDGGDCCANSLESGLVKKKYCTECKCMDPANLDDTPDHCESPGYKGDGYCDDGNNNAGCEYDGGDCCHNSLESGVVKTKHCTECACVDPENLGDQPLGCESPGYKGDGRCDDGNNNAACEYDGGDCCYKTVKKGKLKFDHCTECMCIDPDNLGEPEDCISPGYQGDGNCDDQNNFAGCNYDGGDCCASTSKFGEVRTDYCGQCKCKAE